MTRTNLILLGALIAQVLLAAVVRLSAESNAISKLGPIIPGIDPAKVTELEIVGPTAVGESIKLVKKGTEWKVASKLDYPAVQANVDELLGKIRDASSRGPIATSTERHKQLKVAEDDFERKVTVRQGTAETVFFLGTGGGSQRSTVRLAGKNDVYATAELSPGAAGYSLQSWIESKYVPIDSAELSSLVVQSATGTFLFERIATGGWKVQLNGADLALPAGKQLNMPAVDALAQSFDSLMVEEPVAVKEAGPTTISVDLISAPKPATPDATSAAVEHHLEIAPHDDKYFYVHERGNAHAVLVSKHFLAKVMELAPDKLVTDKPAEAPDSAAPNVPGSPAGAHGGPHPGAPSHGVPNPGAPARPQPPAGP